MSAGIEPLVKCIRIWWKDKDAVLQRETVFWPPNMDNVERARKLAMVIDADLANGTFDRARYFPNSKHLQQNRFSYYIDRWILRYQHSVAPSSLRSYLSHIKLHIRPYWGDRNPTQITPDDVDRWLDHELTPKLSNKTIREILTRWRKIWALFERQRPEYRDPSAGISLRLSDPEEIDPFTREEIDTILGRETDPDLHNLWCCMLWSGLSIHEIIPLAIADLDMDKGVVYVNRSYVRGHYRVTKTRRRKRSVHLLATTKDALMRQIKLVEGYPQYTVEILNRDNRTSKKEKVHWLWYCKRTQTHYNYDQIKNRWRSHLEACNVRYRPANTGRHTYASQLLTSGAVPIEWLANQMGHCSTQMIHQHYGRLIDGDAPDHVGRLNVQLGLG
jgi:integrase